MRNLAELLKTVLTLQTESEIETAIALDFYKIPPDENAGTGWQNTDVGALVNHKYRTNLRHVNQAGNDLSNRLVAVINQHPTYKTAEAIIQVPGTRYKFGERLAATVATRSEKPLVQARCLAVNHVQAKEGHTTSALEPYEIVGDINARTVIVVDDVYKSGVTMRSVAAAATSAGAVRVLGLVGARTMRKS